MKLMSNVKISGATIKWSTNNVNKLSHLILERVEGKEIMNYIFITLSSQPSTAGEGVFS